jgi:hypothetical protein
MSDALDTVLRLVAEGRLTAEEAAPLLDALDATGDGGTAPAVAGSSPSSSSFEGTTTGDDRRTSDPSDDKPPTRLRIEIRENGRQTVNLRFPLALGRFAVDRVPGLTGAHAERIREALSHGMRGPIVEVNDDGDDTVRIVLE